MNKKSLSRILKKYVEWHEKFEDNSAKFNRLVNKWYGKDKAEILENMCQFLVENFSIESAGTFLFYVGYVAFLDNVYNRKKRAHPRDFSEVVFIALGMVLRAHARDKSKMLNYIS